MFPRWAEAFSCCKADVPTKAKKLLENMFPTGCISSLISSDQSTHCTEQIIQTLTKLCKCCGILSENNFLLLLSRASMTSYRKSLKPYAKAYHQQVTHAFPDPQVQRLLLVPVWHLVTGCFGNIIVKKQLLSPVGRDSPSAPDH